MTLKSLQDSLVEHIIKSDRKDEARADRAGRYHNPHALALMLGAAEEALAAAKRARGAYPADSKEAWLDAVMLHFNPTRTMHTFLKKIDPTIDVVRGEWVYKGVRV